MSLVQGFIQFRKALSLWKQNFTKKSKEGSSCSRVSKEYFLT